MLSAQLGVGSDGAAPKDRTITSVTLPHVGQVARVVGTETTRVTADVDVKLLVMHTMRSCVITNTGQPAWLAPCATSTMKWWWMRPSEAHSANSL